MGVGIRLLFVAEKYVEEISKVYTNNKKKKPPLGCFFLFSGDGGIQTIKCNADLVGATCVSPVVLICEFSGDS